VELDEHSNERWCCDIPVAFTNLVCCIPRDEDGGKQGEPPPEAIEACTPRLQEIIALAEPKLFVWVGRLASKWMAGDYSNSPQVEITHPAAILRAPKVQQGLAVQRCVARLSEALDNLGMYGGRYSG
jgi:uracil-DNA glycosylase